MEHPYRPERDEVETAQRQASEQGQVETRLARAEPAVANESSTQLSLFGDRAVLRDNAESPGQSAESRLAEASQPTVRESLWNMQREQGYDVSEYRARVERFQKDFAGKPGAEDVAGHALDENNAIYRSGAAHQIDVAYELGPEKVVCFEASFAMGDKHAVDIVTTDGVAIECKAAIGEAISSGSIYKGIRQGELYLDSGQFDSAVVVCPDGTLAGAGQDAAWAREPFSDVQVCELSDLRRAMAKR